MQIVSFLMQVKHLTGRLGQFKFKHERRLHVFTRTTVQHNVQRHQFLTILSYMYYLFKVTSVTGNGHVASQEELDSVINLLSGAGLGRGTMQTIPEQHNTSSLSLPGYQRSSLSPASSDLDDRSLTLRNKGQRRSEGSIDVSGFSHQGHNTWPNQHRASLPGQFYVLSYCRFQCTLKVIVKLFSLIKFIVNLVLSASFFFILTNILKNRWTGIQEIG